MHLESFRTFLQNNKVHNLCLKHAKRRADQSEISALENDESRVSFHFVGLPSCKKNCKAQVISNATINRYFNTYMDFFSFCDRIDALLKNPMRHIEPLTENPYVRKVPSVETTQRVIKWLGSNGFGEESDALYLMHIMGPRPIEISRLNWEHVDLEKGLVVFLSKKGRKGKKNLKPRALPFTPEAETFFRERHERARRSFRAKDTDPIFHSATGERFEGSSFARVVGLACEALKIEHFTPYCVRHWVVTAMRELRIGIADIGMAVGHSNLNTTTQTYSHLNAEHLRAPLAMLNSSSTITREKWKLLDERPEGATSRRLKKQLSTGN